MQKRLSSGKNIIYPLIDEAQITARLEDLAAQINARYTGTKRLVVVGLLRGSFIFIADLVRLLEIPVEVDFMTVSSYGDDTISSGDVRVRKDLDTSIADFDVMLVEDIIDTGNTLTKVLDLLKTRNPKSLSVCAMLDKPSRRQVAVNIDWSGFIIPNVFVVGYGIDCAQLDRNIPFIGYVKTEGDESGDLFNEEIEVLTGRP
ncbi:MAG: hypoxanthine phosphoribosyltransferase [Proteobacteria bacterium]|nr:hypoxanthine phosphoribosyltransferase [Pseudomonadota bacterium]MCH9758309.1 hypoxanthine phosphoribosyltransferase [Pseudomonadota bacterium]